MTTHTAEFGQDIHLVDRISMAVCERTGGRLCNARVAVHEGKVTLSGIASSYYLKQLALEAARSALQGLPFRLELEVTVHVC